MKVLPGCQDGHSAAPYLAATGSPISEMFQNTLEEVFFIIWTALGHLLTSTLLYQFTFYTHVLNVKH